MKLHKRTMLVQKAAAELDSLLIEWLERHDLTWLEAIQTLQIKSAYWMRYPLRSERHPDDPEKKADEE